MITESSIPAKDLYARKSLSPRQATGRSIVLIETGTMPTLHNTNFHQTKDRHPSKKGTRPKRHLFRILSLSKTHSHHASSSARRASSSNHDLGTSSGSVLGGKRTFPECTPRNRNFIVSAQPSSQASPSSTKTTGRV